MKLHKQGNRNPNYKHGLAKKGKVHPLFYIWSDMKRRCNRSDRRDSKWYHDKGVRVCKEWQSAKAFYDWAISAGWKRGLSIDRIDSNKNYSPKNCQWISMKENQHKSNNFRMIKAFGEEKCITHWLQDPRCKVSRETLRNRLSKELPAEIAIGDERILGAKRIRAIFRR